MNNDLKDQRFLELTKCVASWSKDPSRKVGAIIVGNKDQIVSQGYNGFPRGFKDSLERLNNRETKYSLTIHAEVNALCNALFNGVSVRDCTIYVHGLPPCQECAKLITQSGIKRVVYDTETDERWRESTNKALEIFKEGDVKVEFKSLK